MLLDSFHVNYAIFLFVCSRCLIIILEIIKTGLLISVGGKKRLGTYSLTSTFDGIENEGLLRHALILI